MIHFIDVGDLTDQPAGMQLPGAGSMHVRQLRIHQKVSLKGLGDDRILAICLKEARESACASSWAPLRAPYRQYSRSCT